jgi:hypothetical protein
MFECEVLCYSVFHYCDKIPEKNKFKKERFILTYDFRGFNPSLPDSIVSGSVIRKKYHGRRA